MKPNMVRGQRVVLWLGIGWMGLLLVLGCVSERKEEDAKEGAKEGH